MNHQNKIELWYFIPFLISEYSRAVIFSKKIFSAYLFKQKSRTMNCQTVPLVPTLLRAARDADSSLLPSIFTDIVANGILPDDLNATDHCGRVILKIFIYFCKKIFKNKKLSVLQTALSYICSTDLVVYVDLLLRLPGIDANKADNDGHTPLHFAAQAGMLNLMPI